MDKTQEQPKKCYCARCFLPIETEDKVDIEGQNFHKICSMCCICRQIPTSLKMFYGHVFCNECFKTHVLNRFKGDAPRMHSNSWWLQWAPGMKPQEAKNEKTEEIPKPSTETPEPPPPEEAPKRCICARCLQAVDDADKVDIGGQSFHSQCAKCYFCQCVPKDNVKIYYGQVFCEECFHKHVLNRNKDNPSEFFRTCFEQWQNNAQFSEQMKEFMNGKEGNAPFIFMMQGYQPPFCRCGTCPQPEWVNNEPRKSATPGTVSIGNGSVGTWDLSYENRGDTEVTITEVSQESVKRTTHTATAAEKIEKLTKYLQENFDSEKLSKKWKNFVDCDRSTETMTFVCREESRQCHVKLCECVWQCGPIFVNSGHFKDGEMPPF